MRVTEVKWGLIVLESTIWVASSFSKRGDVGPAEKVISFRVGPI